MGKLPKEGKIEIRNTITNTIHYVYAPNSLEKCLGTVGPSLRLRVHAFLGKGYNENIRVCSS